MRLRLQDASPKSVQYGGLHNLLYYNDKEAKNSIGNYIGPHIKYFAMRPKTFEPLKSQAYPMLVLKLTLILDELLFSLGFPTSRHSHVPHLKP